MILPSLPLVKWNVLSGVMNPKSRSAVLGEYVQFIVTTSSASREYAVSAFIIFPEGISHSIRLVARVMLPPLLSERTAGSTACVESSLKPIISVLVSAATILLLSIETE